MHEMSLTQSVVAAIEERLAGARVVRVRLEIGQLAGVVADSVRFCFDVVTTGTGLDGALLEIVEPPGRAHCRTCDAMIDLPDLIPLCPCGSAEVDIVGGTELLIVEVEVA